MLREEKIFIYFALVLTLFLTLGCENDKTTKEINTGKPFTVFIDKLDGDLGSISNGSTFDVRLKDGKFEATGFQKGGTSPETHSYAIIKSINPKSISIWGAEFEYNSDNYLIYNNKIAGRLFLGCRADKTTKEINAGKPFTVILDKLDGDLGSISNGSTFDVRLKDGKFEATGFQKGGTSPETHSYAIIKSINPKSISIWGAEFEYNSDNYLIYNNKIAGRLFLGCRADKTTKEINAGKPFTVILDKLDGDLGSISNGSTFDVRLKDGKFEATGFQKGGTSPETHSYAIIKSINPKSISIWGAEFEYNNYNSNVIYNNKIVGRLVLKRK
jgi:hypothetical protein